MEQTLVRSENHAEFLVHWAHYEDRQEALQKVAQETESLIQATGRGLILTEANLSKLNLEGFDLRKADLNRAQLHSTNLSKVNLAGASLICPGMERTKMVEANLSGAYVHALAAQNVDFRDADLTNLVDATGSLFHGCNLDRAKMNGGVLSGTTFYQCNMDSAEFRQANLQGCTFNECLLDRADFQAALVTQMTITKCHLKETILDQISGRGLTLQRLTSAEHLQLLNANLPSLRVDEISSASVKFRFLSAPHATFTCCSLTNADLHEADLTASHWSSCNLEHADLSNAKLTNASFLSCSIGEANLSGALAENGRFIESRLVKSNMRGFAGRCANFRDCDLSYSNMEGAYLYRAMLTGDPQRAMSMHEVNLSGANLVQAYIAADLSNAILRGAIGTYGRLNQAVLRGADLRGMNLYEASLVKTDFTGANAANIKGPFFADRCPGLQKALECSEGEGRGDNALGQFVRKMETLVARFGKSST